MWLSNCVPKSKELKQVLAKFKCKISSANCTVGGIFIKIIME